MTESAKESQSTGKKTKEHGAIIVEATLSLSFFMFAIYTVLSICQICYTQERMAVALNSASKQLSQYHHLLRASGADEIISGNDGTTTNIANKVADFLQGIGDELKNYEIVPEEMSKFVDGAGQSLRNDSLMDIIRTCIEDGTVKMLMGKNLQTDGCEDMDEFLRLNHVSNLNFIGSNYIENGRNIYVQMNYDIEVVRLLNIKRVFHLSHAAYLESW